MRAFDPTRPLPWCELRLRVEIENEVSHAACTESPRAVREQRITSDTILSQIYAGRVRARRGMPREHTKTTYTGNGAVQRGMESKRLKSGRTYLVTVA